MMPPLQREVLSKLTEVWELSYELIPDIRFGQMIDFMGFLGQDMVDQPLVNIDDDDFLKVLDRHLAELQDVRQRRILEGRVA